MFDLFAAPEPCVTDTPVAVQTFRPRPYQAEAVSRVFAEWEGGAQGTLVVMATGLGKTVTFSETARRVHAETGGRVLVLAHRRELIFQAAKTMKLAGLTAEIEMGELRVSRWEMPQVVVASIQTMDSRLERFRPSDFALVVVDEAHHCVSPQYRRVLDHFKQRTTTRFLYVTATPDRADEEALGQVIDTVAFEYGILDGISDGWLVPIQQQLVRIESLDFSQIRTVDRDLSGGELAEVMETEKNLHGVADATFRLVGNRKTIVFTASVRHAEMLTDILNRHRPGCADWVCGATPEDRRAQILSRFAETDETQFVCNFGVLTEGFDNPKVGAVAVARPTKSRALYTQMIGRGTRPLPGTVDGLESPEERKAAIEWSAKSDTLILDFVGNSGRHKLITTADILGGRVSDEAIELARNRARKSGKPVDMLEELEKAQREIEERKAREAARKAGIRARATFSAVSVDPFDVLDVRPSKPRGWDSVKRLTEKQKDVLRRNGINPDELPYSQGKQLIDRIVERGREGKCTFKQARTLIKYGYEDAASYTFEEARAKLDELARNGWRRAA